MSGSHITSQSSPVLDDLTLNIHVNKLQDNNISVNIIHWEEFLAFPKIRYLHDTIHDWINGVEIYPMQNLLEFFT